MSTNTGGPAFPVPDTYHPNGQVQFGSNGMSLLDWYAGQETIGDEDLSAGICDHFAGPRPSGDWKTNPVGWYEWEARWRAGVKYTRATAMLAEKARREATGKDSLTVQTREVDDDRWAKFQDGFRISFQPTIGWCAEIRDGSMGYGNTIAEAIANLRARWEERSAAPVVQESSTTDNAAKVAEPATGLQVVAHERAQALDRVAELEAANKELVEALEAMVAHHTPCHWVDTSGDQYRHLNQARTALSKHKGAK